MNYVDRVCTQCQLIYVVHVDDTTELCMSCRRAEAERICRRDGE